MKNTSFSPLRGRRSVEQQRSWNLTVIPFLGVLILLILMMFACSRTAPAPTAMSTPQLPEAAEKSPQPEITPEPLKKATPSQTIQSVTPGPAATPSPPAPSPPVATPGSIMTPRPVEAGPLPDLPSTPGDPGRGERLFGTAGCNGCHTVRRVGGNVGPDLSAIANRAPGRAAGQKLEKPELYMVQSLVYPKAYMVEGFNPVMPNWKELQLNEGDISDLVAYLMTLSGK